MAVSAGTVDVDNSIVGHKYVNGGSQAPETNAMVASFGYNIPGIGSLLVFNESSLKAKVADVPTRPHELGIAFLESIGSVLVLPKVPGWLTSLWLPLVSKAPSRPDFVVLPNED